MSQVYATEPQTSGRVLMETTHGPLEIQLWCNECPLTTRLFLQLCMDGFYDNMLFHRIVPDFLIQTGAVRLQEQQQQQSASSSDKSNAVMDVVPYRRAVHAQEALDRRRYEVHSRLRFNHRGQVAMALGVKDDDGENAQAMMQPQFFITLDEAPYLDGTHVVFGTITGPTMFNALRIGRTDVDESTHQPDMMEHAPRILSVKIVDNPIHKDLVHHDAHKVPWKKTSEEEGLIQQNKKKKKRKGKRDLNVLSFGNEMEESGDGVLDRGGGAGTAVGMKSSHDVVKSQVLSNQVDDKVKEAVSTAGSKVVQSSNPPTEQHQQEQETSVKMQPAIAVEGNDYKADNKQATQPNFSTEPPSQLAKEPPKSSSEPAESTNQPVNKRGHSLVESRLAKFKALKRSSNKKLREEDTMAKLEAFKGKVRKQSISRDGTNDGGQQVDTDLAARMARKQQVKNKRGEQGRSNEAPTYRGQVMDVSDDEEQKDEWLKTKFKCRKHMDTDGVEGGAALAADGRAMDDYRVVDEKYGHHQRDRKRRKHSSKHRSDSSKHRDRDERRMHDRRR